MIRTRIFGEDHPDVATSYKNLALVFKRLGNSTDDSHKDFW